MQKFLMTGAYIAVLVLMPTFQANAKFEIQSKEVVTAKEGNTVKMLFNLYPYLDNLKDYNDKEKKTEIENSIKAYLEKGFALEKNDETYEVKVVLVKSLDEYARPDYANMVQIGKINFSGSDKKVQVNNATFDLVELNKELKIK